MLRIQKGSDTAVIVMHEIYGINAHMELVCNTLSGYGVDAWCPDLLNRGEAAFAYAEESDAYAHFMQEVGFTAAAASARRLIAEIAPSYRQIILVGFSVGATIAWLLSEEPAVHGIVGFYGSRIRNYMEVSPACEALLFFPQEEGSFNVDDLLAALRDKPLVEVHKFSGQHGFSDPYSPKYNEASAQETLQRVRHFLSWVEST
ncbi:dienelactone hydrolase [Paenibacillus taihuensis]|uniref:Dienelactone hydrolase n=1 Tax=Paenibacillus taihuensis TaxID=1156355 RepID=A0A3D9QWN3_9BACL|nr:alpha/beta fold hydrolase [Paenibacillus taihuensis]REE70521.1 dienelactone hydrolase [Paenibacillus taihuensis]